MLEVEANGSEIQAHPWLHGEFQASLNYNKRPSPVSKDKTKTPLAGDQVTAELQLSSRLSAFKTLKGHVLLNLSL